MGYSVNQAWRGKGEATTRPAVARIAVINCASPPLALNNERRTEHRTHAGRLPSNPNPSEMLTINRVAIKPSDIHVASLRSRGDGDRVTCRE